MAAKEVLGTMTCPECGFPDAEIKRDKAGNLYRYCPDCNAQYFTRGDPKRSANLERHLNKPAPAPAADPAPAAAPAPAKPKRLTMFG